MAVAELEHEPQSRPVLRLTAKPPRLYHPFETSEMCPENAHLSVPKSRDSTRLKETPPSAPQADARSAGNLAHTGMNVTSGLLRRCGESRCCPPVFWRQRVQGECLPAIFLLATITY